MHESRYLVYLLEGAAAISGLYYYQRKPTDKAAGFFAYFLLATYFVETIGWIPTIIYRWEELHFLKDGFWYKNLWIHNPFLVITFLVYGYYFKNQLINKQARQIVKFTLLSYFLVCLVNLLFSGVFFESFSVLSYVAGSLMLLAIIFYYYLEILQSHKILHFKNELSFYISGTAFIYYLSCTPIFIYFKYFTNLSPGFVELSTWVLTTMNIFMYSSYSIVFIWMGKKKRLPTKNIENAL